MGAMVLWNAEGVWRAIADRNARNAKSVDVHGEHSVDHPRVGVPPFHPDARRTAKRRASVGVFEQLLEGAAKRLGIRRRHDEAGLPFDDVFRRTI